MSVAAGYGHINIVKLMLDLGANNYNKAIIEAAYYGWGDIVKLMLEKGANNYDTALSYAIKGDDFDVICMLLQKGAKFSDDAELDADDDLKLMINIERNKNLIKL